MSGKLLIMTIDDDSNEIISVLPMTPNNLMSIIRNEEPTEQEENENEQ